MAEARGERETPSAPLPPGARERIDAFSLLLRGALPGQNFEATANAVGEVVISVDRHDVLTVCAAARDHADLSFDHCRFVTGVDQMDAGIEIVYSLWSYAKR